MVHDWRGWLTRKQGTVTIAVVAAATAAAGTAIALPAASSPYVASMPVAGRTQATLKVTSGTPVLDISVARLHGTLLRVSTPSGAPVRPVLSGSRPILLSLAGDGAGPDQKDTVNVVLNAAVVWSLDLASGTQRTDADLRGGKVAMVAVTAGTDVLDVTLPRPAGTLPFL